MLGRLAIAGAGVAAVAALGACSSQDHKSGDQAKLNFGKAPATATATSPAATSPAAANPAGAKALSVKVVATAKGTVLAGPNGHTLYTYDPDKAQPGTSACNDECAVDWPPLQRTVTAGRGVDAADLSTVTRADGSTQVSYRGRPVYYYVNDAKPGDITGDGVGGVWHLIAVGGNSGGSQSDNGSAGSGSSNGGGSQTGNGGYGTDSTAVVKVSWRATAKGKVLVGPNGHTLYTYDPDKAHPGTSACNGKCAVAWPPLIGKPAVGPNIKPDEVSTVTRDDGSKQVTWCDLPLYYFAKDSAPGDVKGDGVGGVWHIVTP